MLYTLMTSNNCPSADYDTARAPYADFVQEPWWNVAVARRKADADKLSATLHSLCTESAAFLAAALTHDTSSSSNNISSSSIDSAAAAAQQQAQYVAQLCTADTFGRIVGMFEQNNVGVRRASPLGNVFSAAVGQSDSPLVQRSLPALHSIIAAASAMDESDDGCSDDECSDYDEELDSYCTPAPTAAAAGTDNCEAEVHADESLEDILDKYEVDSLFQPLDGTALYTLICCMNHR
jgi:hypothetical protein